MLPTSEERHFLVPIPACKSLSMGTVHLVFPPIQDFLMHITDTEMGRTQMYICALFSFPLQHKARACMDPII